MARKHRGKAEDYTSLRDHRRKKKVLVPPMNDVGNFQLQSWMNERLPNMLWAVLLSRQLPRDVYLALLRSISETAERFRDTKIFLTHSELAKISDTEFDLLMDAIISDTSIRNLLAPLRLFDALPDLAHWLRWVPEPDPERAWNELAEAIAVCLFHQSEPSTDLRWLKVRFLIIQHRMRFPAERKELAEEVLAFPHSGDLRQVRPTIRAMEGAIEGLNGDQRSDWPDAFWQTCLKRTPCVPTTRHLPESEFPHTAVNEQWGKIYAECMRHCFATIKTTAVDSRHDGVFGVALYGLTLVASLFRPNSTRPAGRLILRTLIEAYVTLSYLIKKDEPALWDAYRAYGSGQAKLAFLKLVESEQLPRYVDLQTLESLANEDLWQEFVNIDLGHWDNKDLRRMSEEIGVKNIYDKYYAWPSAFVHAQWAAVRNTVFEVCLNPLHRLHRIPRPPRLDLEDVSWDAIRLGNLLLDLINEAYPTFKPRFRVTAEETHSDPQPSQ
jgi:hypothetical protein